MPSIAAFIQSLLSEDMYATGMIEKMDERISELNAGQLRLLVNYCETKVPSLANKTILDAYTKLLRKAIVETDKRHEEEVSGERERLRQLKAAHAGVNAKAWDTSHASLDKELVKFQKFLKTKARRVAEEEVVQEEMEKLHVQLLDVPARRVDADSKRRVWWAIGATNIVVFAPILVLCLLSVSTVLAVGSFAACIVLSGLCWFSGVLRGIVVAPTLDDDIIEEETRKRAKQKLKGYRAEVRRNYEEFERAFTADMQWRDSWVRGKKTQRREDRRTAAKNRQRGDSGRVAPAREDDVSHAGSNSNFNRVDATDEEEGRGVTSWCAGGGTTENEAKRKGDRTRGEGSADTMSVVRHQSEPPTIADKEELGGLVQKGLAGETINGELEDRPSEEPDGGPQSQIRGPCQGGRLLEAPQALDNPSIMEGGVAAAPLGSPGEGFEVREGTERLTGFPGRLDGQGQEATAQSRRR